MKTPFTDLSSLKISTISLGYSVKAIGIEAEDLDLSYNSITFLLYDLEIRILFKYICQCQYIIFTYQGFVICLRPFCELFSLLNFPSSVILSLFHGWGNGPKLRDSAGSQNYWVSEKDVPSMHSSSSHMLYSSVLALKGFLSVWTILQSYFHV